MGNESNGCEPRFNKFKRLLESFSEANGGIKLEHIPAFNNEICPRRKLEYIKEGLEMLNKSEIRAIGSFLVINGWEQINKWLDRMSRVQEPSHLETVYEIQGLIFHMLNKWLGQSGNVLHETTTEMIKRYGSENTVVQKMIDDFRTKWGIESVINAGAQQHSHNQASVTRSNSSYQIQQRFRDHIVQSRTALRKQQDESTPQSKRSSTGEKSVPVASGTRFNLAHPSASRGRDFDIIRGSEIFPPNGSARISSSRSSIAHGHLPDENNIFNLSRADDIPAILRSLIERNDGGADSGNEDGGRKSRQPLIINLPGSIQNNYYVI